MPHKPIKPKQKQRALHNYVMCNSWFDRQNGDTVNTLTAQNITEYMQMLGYNDTEYEVIVGKVLVLEHPFTERQCKFVQGEVLIDPRGSGSLQK